jgi:hypothetical protein
MVTRCVLFEVRTELLNIYVSFGIKGLITPLFHYDINDNDDDDDDDDNTSFKIFVVGSTF